MAAEEISVQEGEQGMRLVLGERAEPSVSKGFSDGVAYVGAWACGEHWGGLSMLGMLSSR